MLGALGLAWDFLVLRLVWGLLALGGVDFSAGIVVRGTCGFRGLVGWYSMAVCTI